MSLTVRLLKQMSKRARISRTDASPTSLPPCIRQRRGPALMPIKPCYFNPRQLYPCQYTASILDLNKATLLHYRSTRAMRSRPSRSPPKHVLTSTIIRNRLTSDRQYTRPTAILGKQLMSDHIRTACVSYSVYLQSNNKTLINKKNTDRN